MPPTRKNSIASGQRSTPLQRPATTKPVKSERTHEENQERAYIAASRRSDRSLEARLESARRASEIHKRRTGRALRVTEEDVLNEEMYEEEEDDYIGLRRLGLFDRNRINLHQRFMAYYNHQQQMRSIVGQHMHAQMSDTTGQRVYYPNALMYPMQQPYIPFPQQQFIPAYLPGYASPVTYIPNPAHNRGHMSMNFPQNTTAGFSQPAMIPVNTASMGNPSSVSVQPLATRTSSVAPIPPQSSLSTVNSDHFPATRPTDAQNTTSQLHPSTTPAIIIHEQKTDQSTRVPSVYPFTTQPAGETIRFYQGMQMQSSNDPGSCLDAKKDELPGRDTVSLIPDPAHGWTISKGQPFPSLDMQSEDQSVLRQESYPQGAFQGCSTDKTSLTSPVMTTSSDSWMVGQSSYPNQIAAPFDDASTLSFTSTGDIPFTDNGFWNNQDLGNEEDYDEWNQLFTEGAWEQNST